MPQPDLIIFNINIIYAVVKPVRDLSLLDREKPGEHLQSTNETIKTKNKEKGAGEKQPKRIQPRGSKSIEQNKMDAVHTHARAQHQEGTRERGWFPVQCRSIV